MALRETSARIIVWSSMSSGFFLSSTVSTEAAKEAAPNPKARRARPTAPAQRAANSEIRACTADQGRSPLDGERAMQGREWDGRASAVPDASV